MYLSSSTKYFVMYLGTSTSTFLKLKYNVQESTRKNGLKYRQVQVPMYLACVRPLLKKTSLPKNEMKNYRPVSKLSFISKILEKIVANRLQAHIKNNHLSNPLQSAHRKHSSTESALLKVHNDIIISRDKGEVTALTLLDLSAAFDTIDHATLTDRLPDWYGISGQAQIWFSSYLQNRHQSVKI